MTKKKIKFMPRKEKIFIGKFSPDGTKFALALPSG
jgi:hypothetical protein